MRNSNLALIRSLVSSVILEGFRDDQARLAELYPEHAQDINNLQPKWVAWLSARFGDSPKVEETHPFNDAIVTIVNFAKKDNSLGAKYRDSEQFRNAIDTKFPPEKRQWQSPNDVTTMSVDEMETILSLSERKKQRFDVEESDMGFEGDRIGKVGPWNLWMPTTRENSCKIVGSDPVTLEPKTTWCTARTSGSNLFYNYVGRPGQEITLFYVIRDEPRESSDWLSVGFVNGEPVLDGKRGGVSVDRENDGLTEPSLRSALGSDYSRIMDILTQKNRALGGKHPARQKIADAAKDTNALEYLTKGLSKDEATDLKKLVASEPSLSPEIALLLSGDDDKVVRKQVAKNKRTPPGVLNRLASDKDRGVRVTVANNTSTPPLVLTRLASDKDFVVMSDATRNPNIPIEVLTRLASIPDHVRAVALNTVTPVEILARIASDKDAVARVHVAGNPSTPAEVLTRLASDKGYDVRLSVTNNKNTPPDVLASLASDEEDGVRIYVAHNEKTPPDVLTRLASDEKDTVRAVVAGNKSTPVELLNKLVWSRERNVRNYSRENPSTPIETLMKVAQNPATDKDEREELEKIIRQREATNESLLRNLIRRIV
jgi:hypothetical protein